MGWDYLVECDTPFISEFKKMYLIDHKIALGAESLKVGIGIQQELIKRHIGDQ